MAKATTEPTTRLVAPGTLIIDANVRSETTVDKTFAASIKQHGVIVPVIARQVGDELHVRDGQMRTLAAIQEGLATIPVYVSDGTDDEAARIVEQLVVNEHRQGLSDRDNTNAFGQLSLLGVSADQIARKTNMPRKRVELAIQVAASTAATTVMAEHQLTLDEAAIVLEFEDNPEDVAALAEAAGVQQFEHEASRIRDRRVSDVLRDAKTVEALEQGYVIVESIDEVDAADTISRLYTKSSPWTRLEAANHKDCPGRAALITVRQRWIDNDREKFAEIEEVCLDWAANGHLEYSSSAGSNAAGGGLSDDEKAKRKLTRENNKLWVPASEVRLAFIQELLQRSEGPAGWELVAARYVANQYATETTARVFGSKLLGVAAGTLRGWLDSNPKKTWQLMVAVALGNVESIHEFQKTGWRQEPARDHLVLLSEWGYTLSEIEERVVQGTANKVTS
jgi:ParB family chromosome partitioning protein